MTNKKYLRRELLEEQIVKYLENIRIPQAFIDWSKKKLRITHRDEVKLQERIRLKQQKELNRLKKMQSRLLEVYLAGNSIIEKEEFAEQKNKIHEQILEIEERMDSHNKSEDEWVNDCEQFFYFANTLKESFLTGTIDEKKMILQAIGSNFIMNDGELQLDYQKSYKPLFMVNQFEAQNPVRTHYKDEKAEKAYFAKRAKIWGE